MKNFGPSNQTCSHCQTALRIKVVGPLLGVPGNVFRKTAPVRICPLCDSPPRLAEPLTIPEEPDA